MVVAVVDPTTDKTGASTREKDWNERMRCKSFNIVYDTIPCVNCIMALLYTPVPALFTAATSME